MTAAAAETTQRRSDSDAGPRIVSIDVMRGATIAGMILVNAIADFEHVFSPLRHAEWDGLHGADLIFPFFVFVMGVSIAVAFERAFELGATGRRLVPRILRRSAILLGIGFFVNLYPVFHLPTMRVTGVLQRLAVVYLVAALVFLRTRSVTRLVAITIGLVAGYEILVTLVAAPGSWAGARTPEGNLAAWIDRVVLGARGHASGIDPEGLLSTIPAVGTALLGTLAGKWLRSGREATRTIAGLVIAGGVLVSAGFALDAWVPINKTLWSGSFVCAAGGLALLLLAALHASIDVRRWRRPFLPFELMGMNAIVIYGLATLSVTTMLAIVVGEEGSADARTLRAFLEEWLVRSIGDPYLASLLYGIAFLLLWTVVAWGLWRRRIFIKI